MTSRDLRRNLFPALPSVDRSPDTGKSAYKKEERSYLYHNINTDAMAVPERQRLGKKSSFQEVYSDVHKSRPCTSCTLCKEKSIKYTHPVKSKDENLLKFLQSIEPDLNILPDACICRNCRDSLSNGRKKPNNYKPRWSRVAPIIKPCEVCPCIYMS